MSTLSLLLSAALLAPPAAPVAVSPAPAVLPATRGDSAALDRALGTISTTNAKADLYFIASDELAGRDTPSPGQRIAARYIAARMERLGLTPCGDNGFFANYQLVRAVPDVEASHATLTRAGGKHELSMPTDYYYSRRGVGDVDVQGGIVYVGTGTKDEVADHDLTGKWALCTTSDADSDRSSGIWRERMETTRAAGAIGLLVLPGTKQDMTGYSGRSERSLRGAGRGLGVRETIWPVSYLAPTLVSEILPQGASTPVGTVIDATWSEKRSLSKDSEVVHLENVAALWPGKDPKIGDEVIILSAHYDHVGVIDGEIYNGADDNGSGTTGLMQIAEALASYGPMRRSVLLLWVSGEEKGLLGSEAWTQNPTLPPQYRPVCDINIDMIGRNDPHSLLLTPTKERPEYNGLVKLAEKLGPLEGFQNFGSADAYYFRSDQVNFNRNLGIPVAFLFDDVHEDYHKPTDTADKIDYGKLTRVARLVVRMLDSLQDDNLGVQ